MPSVKRKSAAKKPAKKTAKKTRAKKKTGGRGSASHDLGVRFSGLFKAAGAGLGVVALLVGVVLWTGGYVGVLTERAGGAVENAVASAGFDVRRVTVKGLSKTGHTELLNAVGPVIGDSILHFDHHRAMARIEELGWVRSAAVTRLLPNTVHVSVRERVPAAVWQLSGKLYLIDGAGAVIDEVGAYEYSSMPLIVGAGAPEAASEILQALKGEDALWNMTTALVRVSDRRWNVRLKNGVDIKFPETEIAMAVADIAALHAAHGLLDEDLEYIDLRDPERVIFRRKGDKRDTIRPGARPAAPTAPPPGSATSPRNG
ncbi:MAG: cell division protein FtsQ/DivIB [Pseudomonadota bacterium]